MINLFIINGPDKKEYIIDRAVRLSRYAFDNIYILDKTHKYHNENAISLNVEEGKPHHLVWQESIEYSKEGDYLYISDADEVLSKDTLDWIYADKYIEISKDTICIGGHHHYLRNNGQFARSLKVYRGKVLLGRKTDDLHIASWGTHCSLRSSLPAYNLSDQYYYIHYKHDLEIAYGTVSKAFWHPESHGITQQDDVEMINSFKQSYGLTNDIKIFDFICQEANKSLVSNLLLSIKDNKHIGLVKDINLYLNNKYQIYDFNTCKDKCCDFIR